MKIKLLVSRSGVDGAQSLGDEIEVGAGEAKRMIVAGQAIPVRGASSEKAVKRSKAERAAK